MGPVPAAWPSRTAFLCAVVAITALVLAGPAGARSPGRLAAAPAPVVEGRILAMPADNLLVTDIQVSRLRAAKIAEGEVLDVEVGSSSLRARFVGRDELDRLLTDRDAWAAADVDALCFENDDRTLTITAVGAPLADLVRGSGERRVVVSKP
jgi:hypothetical protein